MTEPTDVWVQQGFAPLRTGRIHLLCPQCGRKMSNVLRSDFDPPNAALYVIPCDKSRCSGGCKIEGGDYFSADGHPINLFEEPPHD